MRTVQDHLEDNIKLFPNRDDFSDGENYCVDEPSPKQVNKATLDLTSDYYASRPLANQARREIRARYFIFTIDILKTSPAGCL